MPTKQFKWIDRDTAARDILQLVYHAPPQIAEQAVKLLKAIRSPAIIPELKAIFLDKEYDGRIRREVYHAIAATSGNYDFSEFESTDVKAFMHRYPFDLLKQHPTNVTWILRDIEAKEPATQLYIYLEIIKFLPEIVIEPILKFFAEKEYPFGKNLGLELYKFGGKTFQFWIDKNWERIIQSWLLEFLENETDFGERLRWLRYRSEWLDNWPELREALGHIQLDWLLNQTDSQSSVNQRLICFRLLPYAPKPASDLLLKLLDEKQVTLDLETAGLLHQYGDETVQNWLKLRWDDLIYACLIDGLDGGSYADRVRIVHILETWSELKDALFQHAPIMIEEYKQKKSEHDTHGGVFQIISDEVIRRNPSWRDVEDRHREWCEPNKSLSEVAKNLYNRDYLTINSEAEIPKVAVKTYFLGAVAAADYDSRWWLPHLLLESGDQWRDEWVSETDNDHMIYVYTPVRFEAAYALRNEHNPFVWRSFIAAFLVQKDLFGTYTNRMFERHMLRWISRMTDILSGVEPELPDEELPLNARPWFCALVKQNPS
ncbi:MAG: hypothetical protein ABI970_16685 [Chloroflexota bacterium]